MTKKNQKELSFNLYQKEARKTAVYNKTKEQKKNALAYVVLGLAGEAGEIANKYKKVLRGDYSLTEFRNFAVDELGDILWYIANVAFELKTKLDQIAYLNLRKLKSRKITKTLADTKKRKEV